MTLCDPFAINFLASAATKIMNHQVMNGVHANFRLCKRKFMCNDMNWNILLVEIQL